MLQEPPSIVATPCQASVDTVCQRFKSIFSSECGRVTIKWRRVLNFINPVCASLPLKSIEIKIIRYTTVSEKIQRRSKTPIRESFIDCEFLAGNLVPTIPRTLA